MERERGEGRSCTTIFQLIFKSNKLKKFLPSPLVSSFAREKSKKKKIFVVLLLRTFSLNSVREIYAAPTQLHTAKPPLMRSINQGILENRLAQFKGGSAERGDSRCEREGRVVPCRMTINCPIYVFPLGLYSRAAYKNHFHDLFRRGIGSV
jgi:hypothetical protein